MGGQTQSFLRGPSLSLKDFDPQASPLMNVTEDIKSHEQKEQGDTMQEADCAADLTESKFTSDGMFCTFGGHTCVPNFIGMQEADGSVHTAAQKAEVMSIEHWAENGRSTSRCSRCILRFGVRELLVNQAGENLSRQLETEILETRQESSDGETPNKMHASHLSASFFLTLEASSFSGSRDRTPVV